MPWLATRLNKFAPQVYRISHAHRKTNLIAHRLGLFLTSTSRQEGALPRHIVELTVILVWSATILPSIEWAEQLSFSFRLFKSHRQQGQKTEYKCICHGISWIRRTLTSCPHFPGIGGIPWLMTCPWWTPSPGLSVSLLNTCLSANHFCAWLTPSEIKNIGLTVITYF